MTKKNIDENNLKKITQEEREEIFQSISYSLGEYQEFDMNSTIENKLKSKLDILGDSKIDDGFYWIEGRVYLSIWSFKRYKNTKIKNDSNTNYLDAKSLYENHLVTETISVNTHSPTFPTVNGYLEEELNKYFKNREIYCD